METVTDSKRESKVVIQKRFYSIRSWHIYKCKKCGSFHSMILDSSWKNGSPVCPDCNTEQV